MAEGGGEFGYEDPDLDYEIEHDDYDDDDDGDNDDDYEQEVDTTRPFQPGQASTPYHGGEQIQMQTMHHEQSGLPDTSYAETPLLGDDPIAQSMQESILRQKMKKAVDFIKRKYPKVDFENLKIRRGKGKGLGQIVAIGPKGGGGQYKILKDNEKEFMKTFLDTFESKLGPTAEQVLVEDQDNIQEQRQRLAEAEKQQREAEKIAAERDEELREMENLKQQTERTQARMDAIQEEQGSNLEIETELRRLKLLKKNHQTEYENKKK